MRCWVRNWNANQTLSFERCEELIRAQFILFVFCLFVLICLNFHECSSHSFFLSFSMCLSDSCGALRAESNRHVQWFSESDVSDINESDSWPASPVTVLDAVDGVQPELQHTQKESELVSKSSHMQFAFYFINICEHPRTLLTHHIAFSFPLSLFRSDVWLAMYIICINESGVCYLMERFGDDFKKVNLDSVLGPIVQSKILKNKSFLLTCTIPIKSTHGGTNGTHGTNGTSDRQVRVFVLRCGVWTTQTSNEFLLIYFWFWIFGNYFISIERQIRFDQ